MACSDCISCNNLANKGSIVVSDKVLVCDNGTIKYATVTNINKTETDARELNETAIKDTLNLDASFDFTPIETSNYIKTADFKNAGLTVTVYNAMMLLDAAAKSANDGVAHGGLFAPVLSVATGTSAPPTTADGDRYIVNSVASKLTIQSVAWQAGNTVRYTFSGAPDLSGYDTSYYINPVACTNAVNNGIFKITAVDNVTKYIEVTNTSVEDATYDEGVAGSVFVINGGWGSVGNGYHVVYSSTSAAWTGTAPFDGAGVRNLDDDSLYFYDSATYTWTADSASAAVERAGIVTSAAATTSISFTAFADTSYIRIVQAYDAAGNGVDVLVDSVAVGGFDVTIAADEIGAVIHYFCKKV